MAKHKRPTPKTERPSALSSMSPLRKDIVSVVFLYAITLFLFRGIVFQNAAFEVGGDTAASLSYSKAGDDIASTEHVDPVWMPYFFSGMPTFGNMAYIPHNVSYIQTAAIKILNLLYLNGTWTWLVVFYFLSGVFMFFLARMMKFSWMVSLFAAITFMITPHAIGLSAEGHGSKLMALAYLPLVFMLTRMLLERRDVLSFGLLAASIGTLLLTNHVQIAYYAFIVIGLYVAYQAVIDASSDRMLAWKRPALFIGALAIGFCISAYIYLSVNEYAQFSMRGSGVSGVSGGLNYDYATNWSWHPAEIVTLLMPSFFGLTPPYYWGPIEPWTNSTVYVGILPILFSIIALVYRRNKTTIFFACLTLVFVLMSFGRNFSFFYQLLFDYLPYFNKFRAPAMVLHMLPFTLGILGAYGFAFVLEMRDGSKKEDQDGLKKFAMYGAAAMAGLLLVVLLTKTTFLSGLFEFTRANEQAELQRQYGTQTPRVIAQLKDARIDMLWKDIIKFSLIGVASFGAIWLFLSKKLSGGVFSIAILAILFVDLAMMGDKYIDPKPVAAMDESFQPDATVKFLKRDTTLFRVFPLGEMFQDNTFAYHDIQSIGGYSPAKLKIYQTMIDSCLYRGADPRFPLNMNIVNMLNVKYVVGPFQLPPERFQLVYTDPVRRILTYQNPAVLSRAFFVKDVVIAKSRHEVFQTLNSPSFESGRTAVVEKPLPSALVAPDSTFADVRSYGSRRIAVRTFASSAALLVLSEVYYPAGWKATIDGSETEIYQTNYILRSVVVPAGTHDVVFTFDPPMYGAGYGLTNAGWVIALICIAIGTYRVVRARRGVHPAQ